MSTAFTHADASASGTPPRVSWRHFLPALIACACASLPLFNHVGTLEIGVFAGVALCSVWGSWLLARAAPTASQPAAPPPQQASGPSGLGTLLTNILPVWLRHLGSAKEQTETAVTELAGSFASIVQQFEAAGFGDASIAGASSSNSARISLLTLCERQLTPVVSTMEKMIADEDSMLEGVRSLQAATNELRDMASDVSLIAAHTNILAINAAIEAARTGEAGRGFAVIAAEIRKLSQLSAETGKKIGARMTQVTQIMQKTLETAADSSERDAKTVSMTSQVIEDVLTHVRTLGTDAEKMREQGSIIRAEVENLLLNLQFQDRVSQILSLVDEDIGRLHQNIEVDDSDVPTPAQWLQDLDSKYTMEDERAKGKLGAAGQSATGSAQPAEEVTFF